MAAAFSDHIGAAADFVDCCGRFGHVGAARFPVFQSFSVFVSVFFSLFQGIPVQLLLKKSLVPFFTQCLELSLLSYQKHKGGGEEDNNMV